MHTKERSGEKTKEAEMEVGLYDNDAISVRISCIQTITHTHTKCRVTSEVPVCLSNASLRDRDVNVTRTKSV